MQGLQGLAAATAGAVGGFTPAASAGSVEGPVSSTGSVWSEGGPWIPTPGASAGSGEPSAVQQLMGAAAIAAALSEQEVQEAESALVAFEPQQEADWSWLDAYLGPEWEA